MYALLTRTAAEASPPAVAVESPHQERDQRCRPNPSPSYSGPSKPSPNRVQLSIDELRQHYLSFCLKIVEIGPLPITDKHITATNREVETLDMTLQAIHTMCKMALTTDLCLNSSTRPAKPAITMSSSAGPSNVQFSVERHQPVAALLARLHEISNSIEASNEETRQVWDDLHDKWWAAVQQVRENHHHAGVRHDLYDWPAFIRENLSAGQLEDCLHIVYKEDWLRVKGIRGAAPRLQGAANALSLENAKELMIEIGPEAAGNTTALTGLSGLRAPRLHARVDAATIRARILDEMMRRHSLDPAYETRAARPTTKDVTNAVKYLKEHAGPPDDAAEPQFKSKGRGKGKGKATNSRKRGRAASRRDDDDEEDEDGEVEEEEEEEEEASRVKRRRRNAYGRDELAIEMGRSYMHSLLADGDSLLGSFLGEDSPLDMPPSVVFGNGDLGLDDNESTAASGASAVVTKHKKREEEEKRDALVREQLEVLCRLVQTGPAPVGPGGSSTEAVLRAIGQMAWVGLQTVRQENVTALLEERAGRRRAEAEEEDEDEGEQQQ
ncbi:hypothetical protein EsH8_XIV_000012 [Colletotrichum jinshuiense]